MKKTKKPALRETDFKFLGPQTNRSGCTSPRHGKHLVEIAEITSFVDDVIAQETRKKNDGATGADDEDSDSSEDEFLDETGQVGQEAEEQDFELGNEDDDEEHFSKNINRLIQSIQQNKLGMKVNDDSANIMICENVDRMELSKDVPECLLLEEEKEEYARYNREDRKARARLREHGSRREYCAYGSAWFTPPSEWNKAAFGKKATTEVEKKEEDPDLVEKKISDDERRKNDTLARMSNFQLPRINR